jgi:hypothetical protein
MSEAITEIERLRAIIEHQQTGMNDLAAIKAELLAAAEYASSILWGGNITLTLKRAGREKLDAAIAKAKP